MAQTERTEAMDAGEVFAALFARTALGMRYDLGCMFALLKALGSPHRAFQVVSIAGTNGKGSTAKMLAMALDQAGVRTGLFTSPHLHHFCERIQVNGIAVSEQRVLAAYAQLLEVEPSLPRPFSFFEASVAMACMLFRDAGVEVAVMEAGLGGRLDATNVFAGEQMLLALLSRVELDHERVLGSSVEVIAVEKAGLWRRGRPALVSLQRPSVTATLQAHATAAGVPAVFLDAQEMAAASAFLPKSRYWPAFQRQNAALVGRAQALLAGVGVPITLAHLQAAARAFVWPGRYQKLRCMLPNRPLVLVDGGHNPAGCAALAQAIGEDPALRGKKKRGILSALSDKDLAAMVAALQPQLDEVALCGVASARGRSPAQLQAACSEAHVFVTFAQALEASLHDLGDGDVLVVTGSLILVAQALVALEKRQYIDADTGC